MANKYKNTQTLNPALRSIGNMNVRGVVKGGTSDADKKARYGLPVMVSETGYIDPSLIEGGSVGGGVTESRVKELIKDNLQPYNSGQEIKNAIDEKPNADEVVAVSDMSPFGTTNKQYIGTEIVAKIEDIIAENLGEEGDITVTIKDRANSVTKTVLSQSMSPYSQSVGDIAEIGSKIKNDVNLKVNKTDYDADFNNFDAEQGSTKGAKIQSYINKELTGGLANKVDVSAMSPYNGNPQQIGTAIENAINAATKTDDEIKLLAEAKITEDCEVGGTIDNAINAKIGDNLLEKTEPCSKKYFFALNFF